MQGYPGGPYGSNYPQPNDPYSYGGPPGGMNPPYPGGPQQPPGGASIGFEGAGGFAAPNYGGSPYMAGGGQPGYPSQPSGFPQPSFGAPGAPSYQPGSGYSGGPPMPSANYSMGQPAPTPGYPGGPMGGAGYPSTAPGGYPAGPPGQMGGYAMGAPTQPTGYAGGMPPQNYGAPPQSYGAPQTYGAPQMSPYSAPYGHQPTGYYQQSGVPPGGAPSSANIGSGGERFQGTIRPDPNFSAETDCNTLRKAMRGLGTDEQAIINVLGKRSAQQRQQIKVTYKTMFGKDLINELKSELSGRFEDAILALLMDPIYYDAHSLREAMKGAGTNERTVTEIMCTRTNEQIRNIREVYKREYKRDLEKDLSSETSGYYRRVLISCAQGNRQELTPQQCQLLTTQGANAVVDRALAQREAQELYQAGEKRLGTDESCFIRIIAARNMYQLRATFDEFQKLAGHDIIASIDREMSGDFAEAMKSLALSQTNRPFYFAQRLYHAMRGAGTADTTLIRVIITRSEIDLADVKREFQRAYGKTLESFIHDDTSGDYRKILLAVVAGNY